MSLGDYVWRFWHASGPIITLVEVRAGLATSTDIQSILNQWTGGRGVRSSLVRALIIVDT